MESQRFDSIAKRLAARRLSRRRAVQGGGLGLVAGAVAAVAPGAVAQDSTPEAVDSDRPAEFLFVQSFAHGGIETAEDQDGSYLLKLDHTVGQTLYVSIRPDRLVGAGPTEAFIDGFSFAPDNPPNAALVMETASGETNIAMVELMSPAYDPATQQLTYKAISLAQWSADLESGEQQEVSDLGELTTEFEHAHLVIDDCGDSGWVTCGGPPNYPRPREFPYPMGYCWSWSSFQCLPCEPTEIVDPWRKAEVIYYWKERCVDAGYCNDPHRCEVCFTTGSIGYQCHY